MKFAFIEENRGQHDLRLLWRLLEVSRSGFYAWRQRPMSAHRRHDEMLMSVIGEVHQGFRPGKVRKSVCRLSSKLACRSTIAASSAGLYRWQPGRHALYSAAGNQLAAMAPANQAGRQWAGDFTYVRTRQGWLYHAVVMDLCTREVVGWSFARKRDTELTTSALKMALAQQPPEAGCVFHSDQGIEYAAHEYRDLLHQAGMVRSMSRKGTPLDNAVVESYFHSLKSECVQRKNFADPIEATARIVAYTEFYNRERLHSSLGYRAPQTYQNLCA